jgi:nickel/cobalt exporter
LKRRIAAALAGAVLLLAAVAPALAHPHIFIDAKATVTFDDAGNVTGVRHHWTFDEAFSAWSIQGLDTNNDGMTSSAELQPLANENMKGLAAYNYYTSMGEPGQPDLTFKSAPNPHLSYGAERTTLDFTVQLDQPYRVKKALELGVDDPEYYVAITFAGPQAISLQNAPAGCSAVLNPPKDLPADLASKLYALGADVVQLPPDLAAAMRGMQGSIDVKCDYSVAGAKQNPIAADVTPANASSAVDAANAMAATKPIPFGGPPRELGVFLPNTPVVRWIIEEQKQFYQLLTNAMSKLKTDNTAFAVLGTLSFLYGILHAAGPGHGKVVISSYVLANEWQYRKGMMLSFASAMLASVVAVVFILVAALVLNLTGDAMGNAANWIGIGSYLMVALLGLWLIIRHVFNIGHRQHHEADDKHDRKTARRHLYAEDEDDHAGHEHAGHAHTHAHHAEAHGAVRSAGRENVLARAFETASTGRRGAAAPAIARAEPAHAPHHHDDNEEGHSHIAVVPQQLRRGGFRESLGVVLAIGLRPCSGALVVLVFALSQGVLWAGIASVFLMGLGTAITVAALATLAMFAKGFAKRWSRGNSRLASALVWWTELAGAFLVFGFGILLTVANLWG